MSRQNLSFTGSLGIPKNPSKKRKREIKKKDKEFQQSIPEDAVCVAGQDCMGQLIAHHVRRRRHMDTRWDEENSIILCVKHHSELHQIGEKTFHQKYNL